MLKRQNKAAIDDRIQRAFSKRCSGIQISFLDISKVFIVGRESIKAGDDDETLGNKLFTFCQEIKKN